MEFSKVAAVFDAMEVTSKRLEITDMLAKLFSEVTTTQLRTIVYLVQGRIAPSHLGIELGLGEKLALQAISKVTGKSEKEVELLYRKLGDLGDAAQKCIEKKKQESLSFEPLTIEKVYFNLYAIATSSGPGSQQGKINLLSELLVNAQPNEGKIIIRFVTGSLRLGAGDSTVLDALSVWKSGSKELKITLERAFNLTSDLGLVAETISSEGIIAINEIKPIPGKPIRPALAERLPTPTEIVEKLGKCAVEGKFDGFRVQVHKKEDEVWIYSRKQEPMTHMFPDLVKAIKENIHAKECILEGEAIGYNDDTKTYLPFQETITRKRKHDISATAAKIPLHLFVFEILYKNGSDLTALPYHERRAIIENIIEKNKIIAPARMQLVDTPEGLQRVFDECISDGLEGVIAKDLNAPYVAGARKFAWIKLKKSYQGNLADTVDVAIIGFYKGKGKRTEFGLGGLLTAVYDPESEMFTSIAKIGTGFNEEEMQSLFDRLSKLAVKDKPANVDSELEPDLWTTPEIVIEVTADEITRSPTHKCAWNGDEGLALRFPRLTKFRDDKKPTDITTVSEILEMYELQKH